MKRPPSLTLLTREWSLENSQTGALVGAPVMARYGDPVMYSINDIDANDNELFEIDPYSGQIRVGSIRVPSPTPADQLAIPTAAVGLGTDTDDPGGCNNYGSETGLRVQGHLLFGDHRRGSRRFKQEDDGCGDGKAHRSERGPVLSTRSHARRSSRLKREILRVVP